MAFKEITGKDLKRSRSFTDIAIGMGKNPLTSSMAIVKDDNAIKQAIKNLVLTAPGEKPFQPDKGSRVYQLLFEPLDEFTAELIQDEILNTINQYEPRVESVDVDVVLLPGNNAIEVTVEYSIVGIPIQESIAFVLKRPE